MVLNDGFMRLLFACCLLFKSLIAYSFVCTVCVLLMYPSVSDDSVVRVGPFISMLTFSVLRHVYHVLRIYYVIGVCYINHSFGVVYSCYLNASCRRIYLFTKNLSCVVCLVLSVVSVRKDYFALHHVEECSVHLLLNWHLVFKLLIYGSMLLVHMLCSPLSIVCNAFGSICYVCDSELSFVLHTWC